MLPDAGPSEADQLIAAAAAPQGEAAPIAPAEHPAEPLAQAEAGAAASDVTISVDKQDSSDKEKFYDAKATTLPIYGRHSMDAEIIPGPQEAEPQVCHQNTPCGYHVSLSLLCLPTCLPARLRACLSVCLSVCLSARSASVPM